MMSAVAEVMAALLGAIMIVAGIGKLLQGPEAFLQTLTQFTKTLDFRPSHKVLRPFAHYLPWSQLLLGSFLFKGVLVQESAVVVTSMLILFAALQAAVLLKGERPGCGCFGLLLRERIGLRTVVRDATLAALGVALVIS